MNQTIELPADATSANATLDREQAREIALPSEFDAATYRANSPDLVDADDCALERHFNDHGRSEGRQASRIGSRANLLGLIPANANVLEIGPFCDPLLTGPNIAYFDVLPRSLLVERAIQIGLDDRTIPQIDFVSPVGDLAIIDQKFDVVISSHNIEHQPDLVRHLQQIRRILRTHGCYFLIIPDKRFCFDHDIRESTTIEVLAAFLEKRKLHSARSVLEHRLLLRHNDPVRHWAGDSDSGEADWMEKLRATIEEWHANADHYIDVHAWQFTPASFATIINDLQRAGLCELELKRVYSTARNSLEFMAVLQRQ